MGEIKKYLAYDKTVLVVIANSKDILIEANKIHKLYNTSLAALGRTLTMGCIMGSMLKDENSKLTIQIKGNGPIGNIVVCATKQCNVKGYVQNNIEKELKTNGKLDVSGVVGNKGMLTVIKDVGLKEPYIGKVELISGEIAEDFAYYYSVSEQIPSIVSLGVLVSSAGKIIQSGGYIIQLMPNAMEDTIKRLEEISNIVTSATSLFMQESDLDEIAKIISGDDNVELIEQIDSSYKCDCNLDRIEKAIIALGKIEAMKVIEENKKIEVECQFCNRKYNIDKDRCNELFS